MKKITKITSGVIILSLFMCVSGCGNEKQNEPKATESTQPSEKSTVKDVPTYKAGKEIKNAKPYEGYVQIKNTVVQLPVSYEELKEELEFELIPQETIQSEDFIVDGGDFFNITVSLDDFGNYVEFYLNNPSEERVSLKECQVEEITDFSQNSVFFPGGITLGSSFEDVEYVLGEYYSEIESSESLDYQYTVMITDKTIPFFKKSMSTELLKKIPCSNYRYRISFDRNTYTATSIACIFEKNITQEYMDYTLNSVDSLPIPCEKPYGLQASYGMGPGSSPGMSGPFKGVLSVDDKQYLMIVSSEANDFAWVLPEVYEQYEALRESEYYRNYSMQRYTTDDFSKLLLLSEDVKVLTDTETHATGVSYSTYDDHIAAHLVHNMYAVEDARNWLRDYVAYLYPVEGTEITENAITEFKEILEHIGSSMMMEKGE